MLHWVDCGVRVFRVDNPHTKPFAFWSWLIEQVHARDRDVIFLAEAFTKRSVMRHLGKLGFSQSYTYFTWKNARWELTEYVSELAYSGEQEYFRPNFFANTPDILHAYLQHGGRPAFEARLVLAATLSPSYGIYSGFENLENVAVREGSEEYLNSEKYELKQRSLDGPLLPLVAQLNHARREHPALQEFSNITFLDTANEALIAYAKQSGGDTVICVVNLDPHQPQQGVAVIPASLGVAPSLHRPRPALRRALPVADRPQLRRARARTSARPTCSGSRAEGANERRTAHPHAPARPRDIARRPRARRRQAPRTRSRRASGSRPSRCGSSAPSSTRSTSVASSTPTGTARATSAG